MKKMRKGFTLVELLIVIAIIGTLSATMTVGVTGSTSKAKAAAIAANVEACRSAAAMYIFENEGMDGSSLEKDASEVIAEYVGTWEDFNRGTTTYSAEGSKYKEWVLKVDFSAEPDKEAVATALANIKGFGSYGATKEEQQDDGSGGTTTVQVPDPTKTVVKDGKFKVTLWNGKVEADTTTNP